MYLESIENVESADLFLLADAYNTAFPEDQYIPDTSGESDAVAAKRKYHSERKPAQDQVAEQGVKMQSSGTLKRCTITVVYWDNLDLESRCGTPWFCSSCKDLTDTWRGRFDNAHATLRACAAQGGFKDYVADFLVLGPKATVHYKLRAFYQWAKHMKKKVLTEAMVLGTMLDSYHGQVDADRCGVVASNTRGHWKTLLREKAAELQEQAQQAKGHFVALNLDVDGDILDIAAMSSISQPFQNVRVDQLLIIVGGPSGISKDDASNLQRVLQEYTYGPLQRCSLPGGTAHSSNVLSAMFALHDQNVLIPYVQQCIASFCFAGQKEQIAKMMTSMMEIHFLAYSVGGVDQLSAWSDGTYSLADPDDLPSEFRNVLQDAQCMDAWLHRMQHITHYGPFEWKHYLKELQDDVKAMWRDFTNAWSNHGDTRFLDIICTTATTHAIDAGCHFTLSRKFDSAHAQAYTNEFRFRIAGSKAGQRYRQPTISQANAQTCTERVLAAATAKPLEHKRQNRSSGSQRGPKKQRRM